jgi:succinate-semialdehyde dehydrogenase/glutarate-semialdehyde dehydrogenase
MAPATSADGIEAPLEDARLFIAGAWRDSSGGRAEVIDPATAAPMGRVGLARPADVDAALSAAASARESWGAVPAGERGAILVRAAALLKERLPAIAGRLTREQGKTLAESKGELARAVETLAWNGEEAGRMEGSSLPGRAPRATRTLRPAPIGVVAAFTAWNFPAVLVARKLGAALAAGCPVILKAAEEAPYTAAAILECLAEAGLPPGVVNLLFGDPPAVARQLLESPIVRKITFTGSTRVGKELARLAAADLKRCTFELGGHAPVILCADGDIAAAAQATLAFKFASAGQSCIAPSRFYVHRSRYDAFVERFAAAAAALRVGRGFEEGVQMEPLANARRVAAMERLTGDAVKCGARLVTGGRRLDRPGFFWAPTVLAEVPETAAVMNEEPFGPIAPMAAFDEFEEALARANRLAYGFAAYLYTSSLPTAARFADVIRAGNVGINQMCPSLPDAPIGGVGDSGYGYEGGREGIEAFLHFKLVSQTAI